MARSELSETGSMQLGSLALMKASFPPPACECVILTRSMGIDGEVQQGEAAVKGAAVGV